jgi:uncharacterized protein
MSNPPSLFSLALITGASSGIGTALARLLAKKGIALLLTGRNEEQLQKVANELQRLVPIETLTADLADESGRKRLLDLIHARQPDLVVNNAGFGLYGPALTHDTASQLAMMRVNAEAVVEMSLEAARTLISANRKGTILNVSSSADLLVFPGLAVYAATKALVTQFSRSFDEEVSRFGIRILVSCPGVVKTAFRHRAAGEKNDNQTDRGAMTDSFAAEQIWNQISKAQKIHRFDWKTRLGSFVARYCLPESWVASLLSRRIGSYHPERPLLLIPKNKNDTIH